MKKLSSSSSPPQQQTAKKDQQPVISSHDVEDEPFIGKRQTHAFEARTVTTQGSNLSVKSHLKIEATAEFEIKRHNARQPTHKELKTHGGAIRHVKFNLSYLMSHACCVVTDSTASL
jgi:hypothetical protein